MSFSGYGPQAKAMMFATILQGVGGSFFWFLFTLYLGELMYSPGAIGIILMIMGFTSTLPLLPAGYLGDRFGRKIMIVTGLTMTVISPFIVIFGQGFLFLCIGATLWGLGGSFYGPAFLALMSEKVTERRRKYLFSLQSFGGMISGACTILIAGFTPRFLSGILDISILDGYKTTFAIAAFFLLLEYPIVMSLDEKKKEKLVLRVFAKGCQGPKQKTKRSPPPIPWKTIVLLCLPMALLGIGAGLIVPFFQLYFVWRFNTPVEILGILFSITQFFWGISYLIMPYVSDRIGSVKAISIVQTLAIVALIGIPISPSFHFVAMMYIIRMVSMNSAWPILQSYSIGRVPKEHSSFTLSATNFSFNVPKGLTPGIGGYIYEYNLELPFFICAAFYIVATILFFVSFRGSDDLGSSNEDDDEGEQAVRSEDE